MGFFRQVAEYLYIKKRDPNAPPVKPAPPLTLSALPAECRAVVTAP